MDETIHWSFLSSVQFMIRDTHNRFMIIYGTHSLENINFQTFRSIVSTVSLFCFTVRVCEKQSVMHSCMINSILILSFTVIGHSLPHIGRETWVCPDVQLNCGMPLSVNVTH